MALIHCPECGKEISDKAPVCIHCGYPLDNKTTAVNDNLEIIVKRNVNKNYVLAPVIGFILADVIIGLSILFISQGLSPYFGWALLGVFVFLIFLSPAVFFIVAGIFSIILGAKNANNKNPCVSYDKENKILYLYSFNNNIVKIKPTTITNISSDGGTMVIRYQESLGNKKKVNIGYPEDFLQSKSRVLQIKLETMSE